MKFSTAGVRVEAVMPGWKRANLVDLHKMLGDFRPDVVLLQYQEAIYQSGVLVYFGFVWRGKNIETLLRMQCCLLNKGRPTQMLADPALHARLCQDGHALAARLSWDPIARVHLDVYRKATGRG